MSMMSMMRMINLFQDISRLLEGPERFLKNGELSEFNSRDDGLMLSAWGPWGSFQVGHWKSRGERQTKKLWKHRKGSQALCNNVQITHLVFMFSTSPDLSWHCWPGGASGLVSWRTLGVPGGIAQGGVGGGGRREKQQDIELRSMLRLG